MGLRSRNQLLLYRALSGCMLQSSKHALSIFLAAEEVLKEIIPHWAGSPLLVVP